ncbi:toprim domain-containing protein [Caballeronia sp. LZ032]|uniref:toprim domain-containing protein n=1 Tax=Caballeronia sp. LZ032 TaxID=3038565 RepID=UPI00285E58BB|nr:toprim domain-containing protein [Caballeronia sp. LZ032]MDR5881009.1 toprim domain-containing protein [Caballeronia sp. LZ032]
MCEAIIDVLTFWCAGFHNVTAAFGVDGFMDEHVALFKTSGVERVIIAFDRDAAGDAGALKLAERLMSEGFSCYRLKLPHGLDANEYALKVTPAAKSLGMLIRSAEWLGNGKAPDRAWAPVASAVVKTTPSLAAKEEVELASAPELAAPAALPATVEPAAPSLDIGLRQQLFDSRLTESFAPAR